jgi:sugar/nucleoside kinase (ribokinase family)
MNKLLALTIYGHVGFDISITPTENVKLPGGAAYYGALAASLISNYVGIVSVVGEDFPAENLTSLNIDTTGIKFKNGDSAIFHQEYDEKNEVVKFFTNLNVCEELSPSIIPEYYLKSSVFFITTAPPSQQKKVLDWLIERKFNGTIAIDTTMTYISEFRVLLREYSKYIGIIFLNSQEYKALNWSPVESMIFVVKDGSKGVRFWKSGVWEVIPAPSVERVYTTTGAGDILASVCLASVASGEIFNIALLHGVELATESVRNLGVEHLRQFRRPLD